MSYSYALQKHLVSLALDSVPLRSAIDAIESQTPYTFIFNVKEVALDRFVTLNVHQVSVENVLQEVFQGTNTAYSVEASNIYLNPGFGDQQQELSGTVLDETGTPLPGVTVAIRGSAQGVTTDFDGNYSLPIPSGEVTLVFSYVGMTTHVVKVKDQSVLDVIMSPKADPLEEVLLTGYRDVTEKRKTGSIVKITEETLREYTASSAVELIEAVVPGLLVRNTPEGPEISIRGKSSFENSSTPLVVLNGFPMDDNFDWNLLNPEDIKSINVLKDAEASALYGLRSANGVIVIETHDGSAASLEGLDASYRYDAFYGLREPDLKDHQLMNADQMIDFYLDGYENGAVHLSILLNGYYDVLGDIIRRRDDTGEITDGQAQVEINRLRRNDATEQFSRFFLQNEFNQRHNFTLSGRSEHSYFHITASAQNDRSFHKNNDRQAYLINTRLGMQNLLVPNLDMTMEIRTNFVNHKLNHMGYESFYNQMPYDNIVDEEGNLLSQYNRAAIVPMHDYDLFEDLGYLDFSFNRLREFRNKNNTRKTNQTLVNSALTYRITPEIRLKTQYQYDRRFIQQDEHFNLETFRMRELINRFTEYIPSEGRLIHHLPKRPALFKNDLETNSWLWRNSVFFDFWWQKKALIQGTFGGEIQEQESHRIQDFLYGLNPLTLQQEHYDLRRILNGVPGYRTVYGSNDLSAANLLQHREFIDVTRAISYFANLRLHWEETYSLTGTWRQDRANYFAVESKDRRSSFWSVSSGWTMSNASFIKSAQWINFLRLRMSYGFNGNVSPSKEGRLFIARYDINTTPATEDEYFLRPQSLPNPHLRWERVSTSNLAMDFRILNHRLNGSLELYRRRAADLYTQEDADPTLSTVDTPSIGINRGEISNSGVELNLSFRPVEKDIFLWTTDFNFTHEFSRVIETNNPNLFEAANEIDGIYIKGNPVDGLYAFRFEGLSENGLPRYRNNDGTITEDRSAGVLAYESIVQEQYLIGSHSPRFYGGITNRLRYKGFSFGFRFTYKLGHYLRGPIGGTRSEFGWGTLSLSPGWNTRIHDRWRQPGDEAHTDIPKMTFNYNRIYRRFGLSDANVDRADFVRLLFVNLGYDFSQDKLQRTPFKQLQLKLQVDNPWIWVANRWGIDPEYHGDNFYPGIEHANPPPKATLSINARF
ncbi:MAG: SusC/RagA family TonB-linked outer membrane protein [Flavobacteriaceae bacterium]